MFLTLQQEVVLNQLACFCAVLLFAIGWVCIYTLLYINTCMFTLLKVKRGDHKQTSEYWCHQPIISLFVYLDLTHSCKSSLSYCTYCSSLELDLYQVRPLQMAGVSVGCHTFHHGLVFEVVNAAIVDIQFKNCCQKEKQDIKTWAMQPEEGCSMKLFWLMAGWINNVGYSKTIENKKKRNGLWYEKWGQRCK